MYFILIDSLDHFRVVSNHVAAHMLIIISGSAFLFFSDRGRLVMIGDHNKRSRKS